MLAEIYSFPPYVATTHDTKKETEATPRTESSQPQTGTDNKTEKEAQVTRFHVWQDLTGATQEESRPLHATITIEMTSSCYQELSRRGSTISIVDHTGKMLAESKLVLNQIHYGLGLLQPGMKRIQFAMVPVQMMHECGNSETASGTAYIKAGERAIAVALPDTRIIFTR